MLWFLVATIVCGVSAKIDGDYLYHDELNKVLEDIWENDPNRLKMNKELFINWKPRVNGRFCEAKWDKHLASPVFLPYLNLMNSYRVKTGMQEVRDKVHKMEERVFLEKVMATKTMKTLHQYLVKNRLASSNVELFRRELEELWFEPYTREYGKDSSAFEHMFVGEIFNRTAIGMHHWTSVCLNELKGTLKYKSFTEPTTPIKGTISYKMYSIFENPMNTLIFGNSIEFDFGLYTTVFLYLQKHSLRDEVWVPMQVQMGGKKHYILCEPMEKTMKYCYIKYDPKPYF